MKGAIRRRLPAAFALALASMGVAYALFAPGWERPPADPGAAPAPPLEQGQLRAVTLNVWKLSQRARVPRLLDGLATTASSLARDEQSTLPELIGLQELESADAVRAVAAALEVTHHFASCACAERGDGSLRSAVAVAASRVEFVSRGHRCIDLDREWPDRPRCAVEMSLEREDGTTLTVLSTHLSWYGGSMAGRLRQRASLDHPTVWLGDFHAEQGSARYAELSRDPLRDARVGAPATHFLSSRSDLVLVSRSIEVVRGLDRRASFDALEPSSPYAVPGLPYGWGERACEDHPVDCPLSDHLPEGAVLSIRAR